MRISTKLALICGFIVVVQTTEIAKADESNQTKINLNLPQNILAIMQPMPICKADNTSIATQAIEKNNDDIDKAKKEIKKNNKKDLPVGKFTINASAYTASADECGKSDGITASGAKVHENETIACPSRFAFGTKIKIIGYGTFICLDRGGAIKDNHFDIYMKTKTQAFAFGRQELIAEIVD